MKPCYVCDRTALDHAGTRADTRADPSFAKGMCGPCSRAYDRFLRAKRNDGTADAAYRWIAARTWSFARRFLAPVAPERGRWRSL